MSEYKPICRNVHVWYHPSLPIKFTTFPVVSYGHSRFFNYINQEISKNKIIFSDNIIWNKKKRRDVAEKKFIFKEKALHKSQNSKIIDSLQKNKLMQRGFFNFISFKQNLLSLIQFFINLFIRNHQVKNYLRHKLYVKDSRRKKVDDFRPLFNLLFKEHIKSHICDEVLRYHNHYKSKSMPARAAIVCDAQQMSLIFSLLKNLGYKWQLKKRLKAF